MRRACLVPLWLAFGVLPVLAAPTIASAAAPPAVQQPEQSPGLPPTLLPLLTTPEHRSALLRAVQAVDRVGTPPCPEASYVTTGDIAILVPLKLDSQGHVMEGAWRESIRSVGCGAPRILNALTRVTSDAALQTRPLLPGTTIADPQLQQDSVQYAAAAMGAMPAGCDRGGITDTNFLGMDGEPQGARPAPGSPPRPWSERWTLEACGKRADVTMHFAPDATGTEIRATPAGS